MRLCCQDLRNNLGDNTMQRLIDSALMERLRPFLCCSSSKCDEFVSRLNIGKLDVLVIRDDLNSTAYPGNKFWKFHHFRQLLAEDQLSARRYKQVVAFGGNQSNAMLASAHLASEFNLKFKYYTRALSQMARKNIKERKGNISEALALGAQIVEVPDGDSNQYESRWENVPEIKHELGCEENLVIPRGGACPMAEYGLKQLALKIWRFHSCRHVGLSGIVVVPAGTGTTAFFLQKHFNWLSNDTKLKIVCVPVVRNEKFLLEQMRLLDSTGPFPQIISTSQRYKFAVPHPHLEAVWCMLKRKGLLFDLIYAPVAWKALLEHADLFRDEIIYYLHTGGISGNATQLERYRQSALR